MWRERKEKYSKTDKQSENYFNSTLGSILDQGDRFKITYI